MPSSSRCVAKRVPQRVAADAILGVRLLGLWASIMAKDSNKRIVLVRRKKELDHALKHDLGPDSVSKRAEKLRAAAIALIKKCRSPFAEVEGGPGNKEWTELNQQWEQLTIEEIVALVSKWSSNPGMREIQLSGRK